MSDPVNFSFNDRACTVQLFLSGLDRSTLQFIGSMTKRPIRTAADAFHRITNDRSSIAPIFPPGERFAADGVGAGRDHEKSMAKHLAIAVIVRQNHIGAALDGYNDDNCRDPSRGILDPGPNSRSTGGAHLLLTGLDYSLNC
ncbi:hypothetical protein NFI95_01605 [Acetobacteraceae bacterium KSS8]|uniref:Transposase n=1 Tax=Endosaccharibacter trunci TaxID=2812733 RepID=A0ABT1W2Q2_9PROT|nr:hypothetical protein [Acetobacteraceae bacterium KSS8]